MSDLFVAYLLQRNIRYEADLVDPKNSLVVDKPPVL